MKKTKEDAEKKSTVKKPSLATLRGAKLAVAPPSAGSAAGAAAAAGNSAPRGAVVLQKPTTAAPKGLWDNDDEEEDVQPQATAAPNPRPGPTSATPAAAGPAIAPHPRPALVVAGVRPLEEARSGVLPKRHLSLSPTRRRPRERGFSRSPSPRPPRMGNDDQRRRPASRSRRSGLGCFVWLPSCFCSGQALGVNGNANCVL